MDDCRVTIEVESSIGGDGPLTVNDALHQFLDAFEMLSAAAAQEQDGKGIKWRLISMSKNSPARATAEAYSDDPSIPLPAVVYRTKVRVQDGLSELANGNVVPWVEASAHTAKAFFKRNLNGIGRTVFDFGDAAPRAFVVEKSARSGLRAIESFEAGRKQSEDKSHSEFGSIDAHVSEAKTWNGQPALYVRERLSNKVVPCVLNDKAAAVAGPSHSWSDAWSGKRVRIKGQIFYDKSGSISRVMANAVTDVAASLPVLRDLRDIDILQGLTPVQHIDRFWGYADD
jgi:hypothetical protein